MMIIVLFRMKGYFLTMLSNQTPLSCSLETVSSVNMNLVCWLKYSFCFPYDVQDFTSSGTEHVL